MDIEMKLDRLNSKNEKSTTSHGKKTDEMENKRSQLENWLKTLPSIPPTAFMPSVNVTMEAVLNTFGVKKGNWSA